MCRVFIFFILSPDNNVDRVIPFRNAISMANKKLKLIF